jgi:hypothetical protein
MQHENCGSRGSCYPGDPLRAWWVTQELNTKGDGPKQEGAYVLEHS